MVINKIKIGTLLMALFTEVLCNFVAAYECRSTIVLDQQSLHVDFLAGDKWKFDPEKYSISPICEGELKHLITVCEYTDVMGISYFVEGDDVVGVEMKLGQITDNELPLKLKKGDKLNDVASMISNHNLLSQLDWSLITRDEKYKFRLTTGTCVFASKEDRKKWGEQNNGYSLDFEFDEDLTLIKISNRTIWN